MKDISLHEFEKALSLLDKKLDEASINCIVIRAIGGFAMMYYGFRENGYTIDIDSLSEDYSEEVKLLIKEVGRELEIDDEWLNTDCATLEGFLDELSVEIKWQSVDYVFKHIDIKIADITGLIRSKAKAVHDGGIVPRLTDKMDLLSGLRNVGINNVNELDDNPDYMFIKDKYIHCYEYLSRIENW